MTTTLTTASTAPVAAGDVIEISLDGIDATALVLLAAEEMMILDLCDGSTPVVVRYDEISSIRVFDADFSTLTLAA